jgi:alkaline phosphatase/alkaline phosphatase D
MMPITARRLINSFALVYLGYTTLTGACLQAEPPYAAQGGMVGEVTSQSALVQVRLTSTEGVENGDVPGSAGIVRFNLREEGVSRVWSQTVAADAARDFIARAVFQGLSPGRSYECETKVGAAKDKLKVGPVMRFRTHPGPEKQQAVRFVIVTGMNYAKFHGDDRIDRKLHVEQNNTELPQPFSGAGKAMGYPALKSILDLKPDFFVGTGDNIYYDTPVKGRAQTIDEMRRKWREQFVQRRYVDLFREVPTYWEFDDHDYRVDDCDNTGDYAPSPELGERLIREQLPVAPADADTVPLYRTHRVTRDLQIWLVENRLNRSPNRTPDGPDKTIWGAEQKAWLKNTIKNSDATFKLLISPTPMIGPDDKRKKDNHTNIGGFRHERDEFFAWLKEVGVANSHFYILCGDRHWQYHSIHPSGLQEFSCGALVDANSRLGRKPGDPQSTDPDGLIRQAYCQDPASGGFLLVEVAPPNGLQPSSLRFEFMDENGKRLYEYQVIAD